MSEDPKSQRRESRVLADRSYREILGRSAQPSPIVAPPSETVDLPKASAITVYKADGTVEVQRALSSSELIQQVTGREPIEPAVRAAVIRRDHKRCRYCCKRAKPLHVDHVYPVALGGASTYDNLVVACGPCNLQKGVQLWKPLSLDQVLRAVTGMERGL